MSRQAVQQALAAGQAAAAVALARQALAEPDADLALNHLLGAALLAAGQPGEAVSALETATTLQPLVSASWSNLAIARLKAGLADALVAAEQAVQLAPDNPGGLNICGYVAVQTGNAVRAVAVLRQAVALAPDLADAWLNLSHAWRQTGQMAEALAAADTALVLRPGHGKSLRAKAQALGALGRVAEALALLEPTPPADAEALIELGVLRQQAGQLGAAIAALRQAVGVDANNRRGWTNLGAALRAWGDLAEATACYDRALAIDPSYAPALSNKLLCLQYRDDVSIETILQAQAAFGDHFPAVPAPAPAMVRIGEAGLRVGLVSADLRRHSVAYFLAPWLAARDKRQIRITVYSNTTHADDVTATLRTLVDGWHDVAGWSDAALAAQVQADGLDVLIDLSGHTAGNRLPMFALRPARVQATWLGYPGSTGLPAMDWRITDAATDPPGADGWYREKLFRLDRPFLCYAPPRDAPPVMVRGRDGLTFGSFNNASKISPACISLWAQVLAAVPQARLLIKSANLADPGAADRLRGAFGCHGVDAARLDLRGPLADTGGHLATYGQVDIALDTLPYTGTTTTCEALWMGVPVLSLRGSRHVERVGAMVLTAVGLPELVAEDATSFVALAADLAGQPKKLVNLRQGLRRRMATSPLCDAVDFARAMQAALLQMASA